MATESEKKERPQLVKLDRAIKLAEAWVNTMSNSSTHEEPSEADFISRPPRLGLGAKIRKHAEVASSLDPVERKLLKKLGVDKKRPFSRNQESSLDCNKSPSDEDYDDSESRASAFEKKREKPLNQPVHTNKKRK